MLGVLVNDDGVVFVLLFFLLRVCRLIGSEERHLLAVRGPCEGSDSAFAGGDGICVAAAGREEVNLAVAVAIRKKGEEFAVRRPARGILGFFGVSVLVRLLGGDIENPNVRGDACVLRGLGDGERKASSIR